MKRCRTCCIPDTRPDTHFDETGQCSACRSFANREVIDWGAREQALRQLLDRFDGRVIVPSSGGKDSTYQVLTLLEMGADVTVVTARTCHLTEIGRANIDNLARYARTIEVAPNMRVRAKLNRLGLELVGDISWPEHAGIFSTPFRVAKELGIDLIMYGECPQTEYGGPMGSEQAMQMTRRWVTEFGGFLGLRPADFVGMEGITARDMADYELPADIGAIEAHFLGQYIPWDSRRNAQAAIDAGMRTQLPCTANLWPFENLDNAQTGLHDHVMYRKYGYGRMASQVSVDIRNGQCSRGFGLYLVGHHDGEFPATYMGVPVEQVLENIGMDRMRLMEILDGFTDWTLFDAAGNGRVVLKNLA